jgi:hypothetical protein
VFKGFVLSESLKDPTVLNRLNNVKVVVERHDEMRNGPKIWHDFEIVVESKKIIEVTKLLSRQMKMKWYAHFWDSRVLYVVLPGKVFKIPREKEWKSAEYLECKEYAMKQGVEEQYLDFWLEEKPKKRSKPKTFNLSQ